MKDEKVCCIFIVGLIFPLSLIAQESAKEKSEDITVFITKSGKKYHSQNCTYLKGGGISKKLSEVKDSYSPCSKCNPLSQQATNTTSTTQQKEKSTTTQTSTETNSKEQTIYTGPRGGKYHYSKSGKKVYEKKKK